MKNMASMDLFGNIIPEKMTGKKFEKHIENILKRQGYEVTPQANIGVQFKKKKHILDLLVNGRLLVSVKWQEVGGTAEEKVVFEMFKLQDKINSGAYEKGFIVRGGPGWTIYEQLLKACEPYSNITLLRYEDDKTLSIIRNEI